MTIISEYKKQRIRRDEDRFWSAVIIFFCTIGIFAIIVFAAIENLLNARNEVIYENLKTCPKSSVVDYREGEPFVMFKGKKVMIKKEGCENNLIAGR